MPRATRWMWIKERGGSWALAFTYTDREAGPSAKGAVVTEPITAEQILTFALSTIQHWIIDGIPCEQVPEFDPGYVPGV